jgi:replicative DNA helicase
MEIRAKARRLAQKVPLGMIIIDYMQLVSSLSRVERHLQIAEISRLLKQLARELNVPVIALSQLSRAVESRIDQVPTLADLRESGAIEQDADVVMFIYREEKVKRDSEKRGIAKIIVAKQRNGPIGDVELRFWDKYTKFANLDHTHSYEETSPVNEYE